MSKQVKREDIEPKFDGYKLPEPILGMGATMCVGSDRYSVTVVGIYTASRIAVTRDSHHKKTRFIGGGEVLIFTKRRNGTWRKQGDPQHSARYLALGVRIDYLDPSF